MSKKPHFRGSDFNNQELIDAKLIRLNQDAQNSDDAVRKSQVETISDQAAQDILVALSQDASNQTAFTSASMVGFLSGKQNNMEIHTDSASYLELVDGYKIRAKQLLITDVEVNSTCTDLQMFINTYSPSKQEGDVVILANASDGQKQSWIKTNSPSQNVDGYTRLQTDYNVTTIRTMFSNGVYLTYDQASGQFGLNLGTGNTELGAQTIPVDGSLFTSINGSNVLELMQNLESYVATVDASASGGVGTIDTRLTTLVGVPGSTMGVFIEGIFSDNLTTKQVLQESETAHKNATSDRASIRTEFSNADGVLQGNINTEVNDRVAAVSGEASLRASGDQNLQNGLNTTNANLTNEINRATSAENGLDARLDIVEGAGIGSIEKAKADAIFAAMQMVAGESNLRASGDSVLQSQIDAIGDAVHYKGRILADGRIQHKDVTNANHNLLFINASFEDGDLYRAMADITLSFSDSSEIELSAGDSLVSLMDRSSGNGGADYFHVWDNTESADILREGQLEAGYLRRVAGVIEIIENSLDRSKLHPAVEIDIDNKVLKSGDTMTGALVIDKVVANGVGYVGGYDYAAYIKQKSVDTSSLDGTQRALLVENLVYTNGSANPFDLDYANAITSASHYKGGSADMSVAITGLNSEANVDSNSAAIYATGLYSSATSDQLGVNAGGTFIAQNAATSNLGIFGFSDTAGASQNRAAYFALSTDAIDFDTYRVARVANPLPVQDAALIVDDYTGVKHAIYVNGKSEFNGKVIVPSPSADNEAVNLGDVKDKERAYTVNVDASSNAVINHQLGTKKVSIALWLNDELVTDSFRVVRSANSLTIHNDSAINITDLDVLIHKFSI